MKVFEKIVEMLRSKSFERLGNDGMGGQMVIDCDDAIDIVNQVAEEYNNGWIPCSERLPEECTVLCCDKYGEMIIGHPYFDEVSDTNYSSESDNEMMYNCVAWQPLPQPYQPKGE